jgi:hypothetical protein
MHPWPPVASASARCAAPPSRMFLLFSKVVVDELDGGGAFADG